MGRDRGVDAPTGVRAGHRSHSQALGYASPAPSSRPVDEPLGPRSVAAVVLAGGAGRRLAPGGCNKALVEVDGVPLLVRVLEAAAPVAGSFVVVAAPGQPLPPLDASTTPVDIVRDSRPGAGPLSALADGLAAVAPAAARVLVLSTDLAWLRTEVVRLLADEAAAPTEPGGCDWVVPRIDGHPQVLVSCLRASAMATVASIVASGSRSPRDLLERVRVRWLEESFLRDVDPFLDSFRDVDLPDDLARGTGRGS